MGPTQKKSEFTVRVIRGTMIMFSVRDGVFGSAALRESHPWRGKRKSGGGWSAALGPRSHCSLCLFAPLRETDSKTLSDQSTH